jgi:ankyrin repeat protein
MLFSKSEKLFSGNKDVDREILLRIDSDKDFIRRCSVNQYTKNLCDENLFRRRLEFKYPDSIKYKPKDMSWKDFALENIFVYADRLKRYFDFNYKEGDPRDIFKILEIKNPEVALEMAARKNYTDVVEYFIENESIEEYDWDYILNFGTKNKNKKIIELAISQGATNFETGLKIAAEVNDKNLINFFMKLGAKNFNLALVGAAKSGDVDLINYFLEKGGSDWNAILLGASSGGHYNLVLDAIKEGEGTKFDFKNAFILAAGSGNMELIKFLEKILREMNLLDQYVITNAVHDSVISHPENQIEVYKYFEDLGYNNWDYVINYAKLNDNTEAFEFFKSKL